MTTPIKRGDLEPPLTMTIYDGRAEVDFATVTVSNIEIHVWLNNTEIVSGQPTSLTVSQDGKTATLKRVWQSGETDQAGRCYVYAVVNWPGSRPQSFPADGYEVLEIRKDPGDL